MPWFLFPYGLTVNWKAYPMLGDASRGLDREVNCWKIKRLTTGLCSTHAMPTSVWTPKSLNCDHLDYFLLGEVEWETNKTLCNIKDQLNARKRKIFTNLTKKTFEKAGRRFRSNLKAVVEANGDSLIKFNLLSSSSSCCAISTNIPDPLSSALHIVHCFWQVLRATPRIITELLYVDLSWLPWFSSAMCRGP